MFIAVQTTLNNNNVIWSNGPKFLAAKNDFDTNIAGIQSLSDDVLNTTKGETSEKNKIRKVLESKLLPLSGVLNAHATFSDNEVLKDLLIQSKSSLESMKETHLVTYSNKLVAKATELQEVLTAEYGIPVSDIKAISTQATTFSNRIGTAKPKRAAINAAKQTLNEHIDQANILLREVIDNLMLRYQATHSQFYNEYQQSRTIVD